MDRADCAGTCSGRNLRLSTTDSLTRYFSVADLITFTDYFRDIFLPFFMEQTAGMTEQQLIDQMSIKSIEPFLRASGSVFLVHNAEQDAAGAAEQGAPASSSSGQAHEPPPVLVQKIAPIRPESGESTPPSFTAPRPAAATMGKVGEQIARRIPPGPESGEKGSREIIAARRPFKEAVKPGLSYIIDVYDPIEPMNRALYRFNAVFDEYLFLPVTRAYEFITPNFIQDRVSDIFSNVSDVRNLANAMLQLRPVRSGKIFTRFLINTTLGLAGMWDPATSLGFPKHEEDFGQTLGWYGVGPGPYIVLPIFGPSSLRDTTGLATDATAQYFYLFKPTDMDTNMEWGASYRAMSAVDTRHNIPFRYYQTGSPFEYDLLRLLYKKKRELDIEQ